MDNTAVQFEGVGKRFRLGETHDSLRDLLPWLARRIFGGGGKREECSTFWALEGLDFRANIGESIGIIGPNGAGKSTALKLLAGILRPDRGKVTVRGRLAALIEIGAGFHGDLTGRENVFLNGAILGMSRAEVRAKLDSIVAFAGLERFLDMPVKRYSSGMYARLGFSIAAHVDPQVLLVDEVLSVGDAVFRLRCMERMRHMVANGTTLVFVTHNLDQVQSMCPRSIVLCGGRCEFDGPSREAVGHYHKAMSRAYVVNPTDLPPELGDDAGAVEVISVRILNDAGEETVWARSREAVHVELRFRVSRHIPRLVVELNMRASTSENLLSVNSGRDSFEIDGKVGEHTLLLDLDGIPVCGGQYFWNVRMWDSESGTAQVDTPFRFPLVIDDEGRASGTICVEHRWTIASHDPAQDGVEVEPPAAIAVGGPT